MENRTDYNNNLVRDRAPYHITAILEQNQHTRQWQNICIGGRRVRDTHHIGIEKAISESQHILITRCRSPLQLQRQQSDCKRHPRHNQKNNILRRRIDSLGKVASV